MVIFNGDAEHYAPNHITGDNVIIDIQAKDGISLPDILDLIQQNAPLPPDVSIRTVVPNGAEPKYHIEGLDTVSAPGTPYDNEYLTEEAIIEMDDDFYEEDPLLKKYRPYRNGVLAVRNTFDEIHPEKKLLTEEIQDALNILPTVMDEPVSAREKIRLSGLGNELLWHFNDEEGRISAKNRYPDMETIRYYEKFTPYEKQIVKEGHIHPRKYVELKKKIEADYPGWLLTNQSFKVMKDEESDYYLQGETPIYVSGSRLSLSDVEKALLHPSMEQQHPAEFAEAVNKGNDEFRQVIHRAPRVLSEYVLAHCLREGHILNNDEIRKMVADFSLPSLSKVARYHNFALYALADKIRFQETPKEHIEAFGSYLDPARIHIYEKNGFFDWYNAHRDITTNELLNIMKNIDSIQEFPVEWNVEKLLYEIDQNRGRKEDALYKQYRGGVTLEHNDLAIRGRNIEVTDGKYTILMLDADDYRNETVGYPTHCCQRFNEAGESCVIKIMTDPFAAVVVIVRNKDVKDGKWVSGDPLAQAFTWTHEASSTLVFDNMEFADDRKVSQFSDLIATYAEAMPYLNMHVGVGYNQGMEGWGIQVPKCVPLSVNPDGYQPYSDYHSNARALKNHGEMMLGMKDRSRIKVFTKELVPSKYDDLARPEYRWLSDVDQPLTKKLELLSQVEAHPDDPDVQMKMVNANPKAIQFIEHPDLSVQQWIARYHKDLAGFIKDPNPEIYNDLVRAEPRAILNFPDVPESTWMLAVRGNGLLLKYCPHPTKDIVLAAVQNNGIAIQFAGNLQNDPEIQKAAVEQTPLALKHIQNPTEEVTILAAGKDIDSINKDTILPIETQRTLVEKDPANILNFKEKADPSVVLLALEKKGSLIRNFRNASHEMQLAAVRQDGLAIRHIRNPEMDVLMAAYEENPRAIRYMRISPETKRELLAESQERTV